MAFWNPIKPKDDLAKTSKKYADQGGGLLDQMVQQSTNFMQGNWDPSAGAGYEAMSGNLSRLGDLQYMTEKDAISDNFAQSKDQILATLPQGGTMFDALAQNEMGQAGALTQSRRGIESNKLGMLTEILNNQVNKQQDTDLALSTYLPQLAQQGNISLMQDDTQRYGIDTAADTAAEQARLNREAMEEIAESNLIGDIAGGVTTLAAPLLPDIIDKVLNPGVPITPTPTIPTGAPDAVPGGVPGSENLSMWTPPSPVDAVPGGAPGSENLGMWQPPAGPTDLLPPGNPFDMSGLPLEQGVMEGTIFDGGLPGADLFSKLGVPGLENIAWPIAATVAYNKFEEAQHSKGESEIIHGAIQSDINSAIGVPDRQVTNWAINNMSPDAAHKFSEFMKTPLGQSVVQYEEVPIMTSDGFATGPSGESYKKLTPESRVKVLNIAKYMQGQVGGATNSGSDYYNEAAIKARRDALARESVEGKDWGNINVAI